MFMQLLNTNEYH